MGWGSKFTKPFKKASNALGAVADKAKEIVTKAGGWVDDKVDSLAERVAEWCDEALGKYLGGVAMALVGVISGIIHFVCDSIEGALFLVADVIDIIAAVLSFDWRAIVHALKELLSDALHLSFAALQFLVLGYFIGETRRLCQLRALRKFVSKLLNKKFGAEPDRLERMRSHVGLNGGGFGLPMNGVHHRFRYPIPGTSMIQHGMTAWDIEQSMRVARNKVRNLGVKLKWTNRGNYDVDPAEAHPFDDLNGGQWLKEHEIGAGDEREDGAIMVFAAYLFKAPEQGPTARGRTVGRDFDFGEGLKEPPPDYPYRSDGCVVVIDRNVGSGIFHRDISVETFKNQLMRRWVLVHECGHYLGLCHRGHVFPDHIMYSDKKGQDTDFWADSSWGNSLWGQIPRFSLKNGRNCWRWMVYQWPHVLENRPPS